MAAAEKLRIGTRASPLARWQAEWVAAALAQHGVECELIHISTQGDRQQVGPIEQIGTMGVFTKELQRTLHDGGIDLAVHSLKDLPTETAVGLILAAVPKRGPEGDVLVSRNGSLLDDLPQGAVIGTGSLRRRVQLWRHRRDLKMSDIRGNVDTRLRKLNDGQYDALVLAEAGLKRLELGAAITQIIPKSILLPAVGQGALGLECRSDDNRTRQALQLLDDPATHAAVVAERALLAMLHGGCLAPIGAWGRITNGGALTLSAIVVNADGSQHITAEDSAPIDQAVALGQRLAETMIAAGAAELIATTRSAPRQDSSSTA